LLANPSSGQVVAGKASIHNQNKTLTINQTTHKAVINWKGFSINSDETTRFIQPSTNSATLNRVTGALPSSINGLMEASGRVYLINPNGIVVGPNGRIDTRGFVGSTLDVPDVNFMNDQDLIFSGNSDAAIINLGEVSVTGGDIFLIARQVENQGDLKAPDGTVGLAGGCEILLTEFGEECLVVKAGFDIGADEIGVDNTGVIEAAKAELKAAAGNVYALAVNNGGVIYANGLVNKEGKILLEASGGAICNSGRLEASLEDGQGGEIVIDGSRVKLLDGTTLIANGENGGGRVTIGSGETLSVLVDHGADIQVDALEHGTGGNVLVRSENETLFKGSISARGGDLSGDGGFVEVSSAGLLNYSGLTDTRALNGIWGTLLLDPKGIIIDSQYSTDTSDIDDHYWDPYHISLNLANGNVELEASETISFTAGTIFWLKETNLTLDAPNITFWEDASVQGEKGTLTIIGSRAKQYEDDNGNDTHGEIAVKILEFYQDGFADKSITAPSGEIVMWGKVSADNVVVELADPQLSISSQAQYGANTFSKVTIDNKENSIGNIRFLMEDGTGNNWVDSAMRKVQGIFRTVSIYSTDNLTIDSQQTYFNQTGGALPRILLSDAIFQSEKNITLAAGSCFEVESGMDAPVFAAGKNFINNAGADAFPDFFYVYSQSPLVDSQPQSNDMNNGLTGTRTYNMSFDSNHPYAARHDDHPYAAGQGAFAYTLAPNVTLTPSANWDYRSTYGLGGADEPANAVDVSESGLVEGDAIAYSNLSFDTLAQWDSDAGEYMLTIVQPADLDDLTIDAKGYGFEFEAGSVTIDKLLLTIIADNFTRTYGESNPTNFAVSYAGLANGEDETVVSNLTVSTVYDEQTDADLYADSITVSGGTATNYDISLEPGDLTIVPAKVVITANDTAYHPGGIVPELTVAYDGFMTWDLNGQGQPNSDLLPTDLTVGLEGALDIDENLSLGRHYMQVGFTEPADSNYTFSYPFDINTMGVLTVTELMTLLVDDSSRLYGQQNPMFTISGEAASVVSNLVFSTQATQQSDVGTYGITLSDYTAPDYHEIEIVDGKLDITPASLTISANNASAVYGDSPTNLDATVNGLMSWDDESLLVYDLTVPAGRLNVGDYSIGVANTDAGNNYTLSTVEGVLSVIPASLIVTAEDKEMFEGDVYPVFTAFASGLKYDDTMDLVQGLNLYSDISYTPKGSNVIYPSLAGEEFILQNGNLTADNYIVTAFYPGTLVIKDKPPFEIINIDDLVFETVNGLDDGSGSNNGNPFSLVSMPFGINDAGAQKYVEYAARLYLDSVGLDVRDVAAWLKDPANAALVTFKLYELLSAPIKQGTELYQWREAFKAGLTQQIIEAKVLIAQEAVALYEAWKAEQQDGANRLLGLLGGTLEIPDEDFVTVATDNYIYSSLSMASLVSLGTTGAVIASQGLFPLWSASIGLNKITGLVGIGSSTGTIGGIASGAIFAITTTIARAVQLVEYDKVENKYANLVNDAKNFDIDTLINGDETQNAELLNFMLLFSINPTQNLLWAGN
jgi:filamentous hemagglutinin family protein